MGGEAVDATLIAAADTSVGLIEGVSVQIEKKNL
jgi:hypothetical protein